MRGGLALALIVGVVAALLFVDLARQATDQLERHVSARSEDGEAQHRRAGGWGASAAQGFIGQVSVSVFRGFRGGAF